MRTIKFRAWIKYANAPDRMVFWDNEQFETEWLYQKPKFVELMQFTGFYDKNGTEVYEGDVIEFPFLGGLHREKIEEHNHDGHEYCWWLSLPWNRVFTVIGNIYENPELAGRTE